MINNITTRVVRKLHYLFCSAAINTFKLISNLPGVYSVLRFHYKFRFFNGGGRYIRFFGAFDSAEAAKKYLDNKCPSEYAETDLTDINIKSFSQVHLFDYPVIYWLQRYQSKFKSLIDFGGHIGVKYYAYKDLLPNINDVLWTVIEVPFAVERGRKIAFERGANNLTFANSLEGEECDVLFISGAIQYSQKSIDELLDSMNSLPRYIIINKLPVHSGSDLFTLENFGDAKIIYHIFNKNEFDHLLQIRGFNKIDVWVIPSREISIPFLEERLINFEMQGQVWERTNINP